MSFLSNSPPFKDTLPHEQSVTFVRNTHQLAVNQSVYRALVHAIDVQSQRFMMRDGSIRVVVF
jgi:hypothetical protein